MVKCQQAVLCRIPILIFHTDHETANSSELTQLLCNPASTEAAVAAAAGWCDFHYQKHEQQKKRMQQQQGQPARRGASSNRAATRSSHSSSSSRSRGASGSNSMASSSSSRRSSTRAAAETLPASLLLLDLFPDHKEVVVGLAADSARVYRLTAQELEGDESDTVAAFLFAQIKGARERSHCLAEDPGQPFSGISILAVDCLGLLLELVVLAGAEAEKGGRLLPRLADCLEVLQAATSAADNSEMVSFIAARGELLLQLCNIANNAVNEEQQRTGQLSQKAAKCRRWVLWLVATCARLQAEREYPVRPCLWLQQNVDTHHCTK